MPNISQLREEHVRLVEIIGHLEKTLALPAPPPSVELFALRRELTSALVGHLKNEDWVLYPRLLASRDKHVAATARAFVDEMGGLATAFSAYSEKWGATEIARNWAGYRGDSSELVAALMTRIARENSELYPLLDEAARQAA